MIGGVAAEKASCTGALLTWCCDKQSATEYEGVRS